MNGRTVTKTTAVTPSIQCAIQTFGRISKAQPGRPPAGKSKARASEKIQSAVCVSASVETPIVSRKRKAQHIDEAPESEDSEDHLALQSVREDKDDQSRQGPESGSTRDRRPKTPRKKALCKAISIETPTKGARSYLATLNLSSSPSSREGSLQPGLRADTPASSPPPVESSASDREATPELPEELQDLINLHSSFLTALSLHYAHHGSLTPVDFRNLRPNVERSWRKRRVSIHDVQQILALQQASSTPAHLSLSDYGSSKICVEMNAPPTKSTTHRRPLNEEHMNQIFLTNLLDAWISHTKSRKDAASAEYFIRSLPLAPITPCTSRTALAPLLAKGQRRLEDLKAGAIKAQARSRPGAKTTTTINEDRTNSSDAENIPPASPNLQSQQPPPPSSITLRKTSLLDRIRAKQAAQTTCAVLTTPELQRRAALRRIDDIVPVLELLCASTAAGGVKTFTMATVVQHLQMSLRNPIEKEVAVRAVRLLAEEVSPGWVTVREVGKVVGVVVRKGWLVGGKEEVLRRVKELEGRF
ncbi:MAG: hypothetical protein L6R39_005380 [Caloplaca ligustica]|nr:MAG: hypothetical protein L6R39_005380 [Caloplaca ligustica]